MSPMEILGMLEEAAGTRMYEQKKENALKTLQKKEGKVEEINKVLPCGLCRAVLRLKYPRKAKLSCCSINTFNHQLRVPIRC